MNELQAPPQERFLSRRQRYQPVALADDFSDEELARDWTLTSADKQFLAPLTTRYRLFNAVQLCAMRLHGRFLGNVREVTPRILNYLAQQLELPVSLTVAVPERKRTAIGHRNGILRYLGYRRFDEAAKTKLEAWLVRRARQGELPVALFARSERYLLDQHIGLPGPTTIERLVLGVCATAHVALFEDIHSLLSPELKCAINRLLTAPDGEQRSMFYQLKAYPPSASIASLQDYLGRYAALTETHLEDFNAGLIEPTFLEYLFQMACRYNAKDLKRFPAHKRFAMMICFLLESRKVLLDHLAKMHDQYMMDMCRHARLRHEKLHRQLRKRQKRAIDTTLKATDTLLEWPAEEPFYLSTLWQRVDERELRASREDLRAYKRLEERGYGDLLLARYPSMRKYFVDFINLPFAAAPGSEPLLHAIELVRLLDQGALKQIPPDAPTSFVPRELRRALIDGTGKLKRNAWETGLALAIKDALRSGDLYLPQSKTHLSFLDLLLSDVRWADLRETAHSELQLPKPKRVRSQLVEHFNQCVAEVERAFGLDPYAEIVDGRLRTKRDGSPKHLSDNRLQKAIDTSIPHIRIEQLLMEVDQATGFTRHFVPMQRRDPRPGNFYKTLIAAIISQATNLGVVAMSESVDGISVDILRHVLRDYVREDTIKAASAEVVNRHHELPLSAVHGTGQFSSSDGQRFKIRADSLLGAFYPRYFGYYDRAIGVYTHVSDQHAVFGTQAISCANRESLYVLEGLLDNNTILRIKEHTTDTDGFTEILMALTFLLGFEFIPRIKNMKDQQLYRVERDCNSSVFAPLLNKTSDVALVEEQWESMMRLALSLKEKTAPAHVIVQRLTCSYPSDRLSKAVTELGRIKKTEHILRTITDPKRRRRITRQLNKGEYRQKLARWVFFANQGEFDTGDYVEIMNKVSCLSLVCNAILYWNTVKIAEIVNELREQGEEIDDETLSHISLLPHKHVLVHGTYFINEE